MAAQEINEKFNSYIGSGRTKENQKKIRKKSANSKLLN
jgi:hypothetical protein